MPQHTIGLEWIGENTDQFATLLRSVVKEAAGPGVARCFSFPSRKPWVAKITDTHPKYQFQRKFLRGKVDYTKANSKGSRGVYLYFVLEPNAIYEIFGFSSWRRTFRYFLLTTESDKSQIRKQDVIIWLKHRSA